MNGRKTDQTDSPILTAIRNHKESVSQEEKSTSREIYIALSAAEGIVYGRTNNRGNTNEIKESISAQLAVSQTRAVWQMFEGAYENWKNAENLQKQGGQDPVQPNCPDPPQQPVRRILI